MLFPHNILFKTNFDLLLDRLKSPFRKLVSQIKNLRRRFFNNVFSDMELLYVSKIVSIIAHKNSDRLMYVVQKYPEEKWFILCL